MPLDALLIQTPNVKGTFFNLPGKEIPLSLCYLGSFLQSRGFTARILDLDWLGGVSPHLEKALAENAPALVGISAYTPNIALAAQIAAGVKQLTPATPVVLGGFHASALPERTLREFAAFDCLIIGEGEQTLAELVASRRDNRSFRDLPGLAFREDDAIRVNPPRPLLADLDMLPFPDRRLVPYRQYVPDPGNYFSLPSTGILFSRGCPHLCTYCSKAVFKNRLRYRGVDNFLAEIRHCVNELGIRDFRLEDEAPTTDPRRIRELSEALLAAGLAIHWHCYSRVDRLDEATLRLMKRAGCYHITYGIESGVPATLARINKPLDLERAAAMVALTKKLGLECKVNFILGFPWETIADMRQTVRFARRISPDLVTFNLFKPLPGSLLYDELDAAGRLRHTRWEDYFTTSEPLLFAAPYTEAEALAVLRNAVFSFYFRWRYIGQRLRRLVRHPRREAAMAWRGVGVLLREWWVGRRRWAAR